jgi:tape measure domain-containing protein
VSVVANVAINVDSRGATQKLREVQQAAQQAQRALEDIGGASGAKPFRAASSSASELIGVLGRLSAAYLGLRTAQQAVQAGIQREESVRRLTFLAKGYGEVARAQELAAQSGRTFGLSASESNQQFAQLYGRLRPLNVSLEDINAAFVGFNTAAKVSGATTAESAGALLQLTQALGSGVLRGQELNSVLEQAPGLVIALTKELGKPVSEIRKLAEQGEITSDVVIRALKRAGTEGADELAAAMNGPAQAVKNLQNEFENFQVAATQDLIPTIVDAMKGLRELLISLGPIIRGIGGIAAQTIGTITDVINAATRPGATAAAVAIKGGRLPLAGLGGMSGAGELFKGTSGAFGTGLTGLKAEAAFLARQRRQPVTDVLLQLMQNRLQRMETPAEVSTPDLPATFISSGATDGKKAKGKTDAERAAERLKKEIEQSLELGDRLGTEFKRQVILLDTSSEIERKRLQIQFDFEDRAKQIGELKNAEQRVNLTTLNKEIKRLDTLKLQTEELKKQIEEFGKRAGLTFGEPLRGGAGAFRTDINLGPVDDATKKTEELKKRFEELIDPVNMAITGAQGIGSAFSSAFQSIITGAQSTKQVLADFFKGIGDAFVQMATEIIAQMVVMFAFKQLLGLFGGGGGGAGMFSGQGPVTMPAAGVGGGASMFGAGAPSFFAEGGFVTGPTRALIGEGGEPEYVIPASKMRTAMGRYAAGARGAAVIPGKGGTQAGETGAGAATMEPIDVRYSIERINSVDYVTADQFQRGMQQAATKGALEGERRTLLRLQQSPNTRSRIGI